MLSGIHPCSDFKMQKTHTCCVTETQSVLAAAVQGQVVTCIASEPLTGNIWTGHASGLVCLHVHGQ